MVKYFKQEMNNLQGKKQKNCFYKMESKGNISIEEFINEVASPGSGLSPGTVYHVLNSIEEQLAIHLGRGYTININGLGSFKASLGVRSDKEVESMDEQEQKRNARSIKVSNILYNADKELIKRVNDKCRLTRGRTRPLHKSPYTKQERAELLKEFLRKSEGNIAHISDYVRLTGLSRTKAQGELVELRNDPDSGITYIGKSATLYYKLSE